jgi:hypothetical protein
LVARDGIEPPTPAFSGLDSSSVNYLKLNTLKYDDRLKSLLFWDRNGTKEWDNNSGRSNLPSLSIVPLPLRPNGTRSNSPQVRLFRLDSEHALMRILKGATTHAASRNRIPDIHLMGSLDSASPPSRSSRRLRTNL